jgi:hypothetical protein
MIHDDLSHHALPRLLVIPLAACSEVRTWQDLNQRVAPWLAFAYAVDNLGAEYANDRFSLSGGGIDEWKQ